MGPRRQDLDAPASPLMAEGMTFRTALLGAPRDVCDLAHARAGSRFDMHNVSGSRYGWAALIASFAIACGGADDAGATRGGSPAAGSGAARPPSSGIAGSPFGGGPQNAGAGASSAGTGSSLPPQSTGGSSSELCEVVQLVADPQIPQMMIVLDRSGSMEEGMRWLPSVSAVKRVTTELQSKIDFGLTMFPDPANQNASTSVTSIAMCFSAPDPQACIDMITGGSGGNPGCAPGPIVVPVGNMNAMKISDVLGKTQPLGGTPTSGTLEGLLSSYASEPQGPDQKVSLKYVLLVTDGQPTCPAGQGSDTTPADIDASNAAIDALTQAEVRTYVIGYDTSGAGNEQLAQVLDGFAQRGGTGEMKHRPVEDEASLLAELQTITSEIVGCSLTLDKAPPRADYVLVKLDGRQLNLNDANGWMLRDEKTVELTGQACETFKSGSHSVEAQVQCEIVGPA
jgi:hypothetical protein